MLELHHSHASTCSQRVRQALHEKGLQYTSHLLNFATNDQLKPEYLKLNPNGTVPALVHDGRPIPDSSVIMEYLEDVFPEAPALRPRDHYQASRLRAWVQYIDEIQTPAIRYPSFQKIFRHGFSKMPRDKFEAVAAQRPIRKHFFLSLGPDGFPAEQLDAAMELISQSLDRMEVALADAPWILGSLFTIVDISCLPSIVRLDDLGMMELVTSRPRVAQWYARCQQRPSFAAAYYPESRVGAR